MLYFFFHSIVLLVPNLDNVGIYQGNHSQMLCLEERILGKILKQQNTVVACRDLQPGTILSGLCICRLLMRKTAPPDRGYEYLHFTDEELRHRESQEPAQGHRAGRPAPEHVLPGWKVRGRNSKGRQHPTRCLTISHQSRRPKPRLRPWTHQHNVAEAVYFTGKNTSIRKKRNKEEPLCKRHNRKVLGVTCNTCLILVKSFLCARISPRRSQSPIPCIGFRHLHSWGSPPGGGHGWLSMKYHPTNFPTASQHLPQLTDTGEQFDEYLTKKQPNEKDG